MKKGIKTITDPLSSTKARTGATTLQRDSFVSGRRSAPVQSLLFKAHSASFRSEIRLHYSLFLLTVP
jgi:hypothetical protein